MVRVSSVGSQQRLGNPCPTHQAFGRPVVAALRHLAGFVQKLLLTHTYDYPALPKAAATQEHLHSAAFGSAYHSLGSKSNLTGTLAPATK
jgi:hypothetical protein